MKTRSDFVSNSSSCSFVLELAPGLSLRDFVDAAAKGCMLRADMETDDAAWRDELDELNRATLDYHLRASSLLYLGALDAGEKKIVARREDDPEAYDRLKQYLINHWLGDGERVVRDEDGVLEIARRVTAYGVAVRECDMRWIAADHWNDDWTLGGKAEAAAKKIAEYMVKYDSVSDADCRVVFNSRICSITKDTVWNTRALIAAGYKVELDGWMDLDALEEKLKGGSRLVVVQVNNGGEGVDADALYTFGGWDGEDALKDIDGAVCLASEVG